MQSQPRQNGIQRAIARLTNWGRQGKLQGSQVPLTSTSYGVTQREQYDLEVAEVAIRDVEGSIETSRMLIEMAAWCYIVRHSSSYLSRDILRSKDGDSTGWAIAETLADGTPINPDTKAILNDLINRFSNDEFVLGRDKLEKAVRLMCNFGDCFAEMSVDREGLSDRGRFGDYGIQRILYLPTWQMFVKEDRHGEILEYQQRSRLVETEPDVRFFPEKIIHWRYEEQTKYGQSLFLQGVDEWRKLKKINFDIEKAVRAIGITPNIHTMPPNKDEAYRETYKRRYEQQQREGILTDLFLLNGAAIEKMKGVNSNLDALFKQKEQCEYKLIPAGLPLWMYPGMGLEAKGAREISNEPAKAYEGLKASLVMKLVKGIRKACNLELRLKLGPERFAEIGQYRITFPDFAEAANSTDDRATTEEDVAVEDAIAFSTASRNGKAILFN